MTKKKLIIGLGTGRCGTKSLSRFLSMQRNAYVSHELKPTTISWYDSFVRVELLIKEKLKQQHNIVGDVGFFFLPYVEYIIEKFKYKAELYFICLQRDKAGTIESFRKKQKWSTTRRHPWYLGPGYPEDYRWDRCYPKFGFISRNDALSYYWDMYYDISYRLQCKYPNTFRIFNIESLNTVQGQRKILTFLHVDKKSMMINKNLSKLNKFIEPNKAN